MRVCGERRCLHPLRTNIPLKTTSKPENAIRGYLAALGFPDMSDVLLEFLYRNGGGLLETVRLNVRDAVRQKPNIVKGFIFFINSFLWPSSAHRLLQHLAHQTLGANDDLSAFILVLQRIGIYAHGGRLIV